jgi:hypothetical protein
MSQTRFFLLPLLGCLALLFAGSLVGLPSFLSSSVHGEDGSAQPATATPPPQTLPILDPATARPDAEANQTLDAAVSRLAPPGPPGGGPSWLEMNLWQQVTIRGLAGEVEGRYQSGPNRCFRLELATRQGGTEGRLRVLSDGKFLWQATRIGGQGWAKAGKVDLARVRDELANQQPAASPWDDYLQSQAGGGPLTLLANLRRQLTWVRKEMVMRQGLLLAKLTGTWAPAALAEMGLSGKGAAGRLPSAAGPTAPARGTEDWPAGQPRQCRLYLDGNTLWPYRVEWWGPDPPRPSEALLMEMELREPILNRALSPEQCARAFTWEDGDVPDATGEALDQLRERKRPR